MTFEIFGDTTSYILNIMVCNIVIGGDVDEQIGIVFLICLS